MFLLGLLGAGAVIWFFAHIVLRSLFLRPRFYMAGGGVALVFFASFFLPFLMTPAYILLTAMAVLLVVDLLILFGAGKNPLASRLLPERLSNGDDNPVTISISNRYSVSIHWQVIDELPLQFQERKHFFHASTGPGLSATFRYLLRPVERGVYKFGDLLLYASTQIGLISRCHRIDAKEQVAVYPSFIQMRRYELMAQFAQTHETGSKRMRKIGHSMEFEQVKDYILGDDIRNINWKATARKGNLMVNNYTEQRSQQIFCLIDKGRVMKMPFEEMSLLDYSINASLMLCNVSLYRQDRFGLLTFSNTLDSFLPADRNRSQLEKVLKSLYNQQTAFLESDFEMLYTRVRALIKQRSLLLLFTNFESFSSLQRQLPYLVQISKHHLLLVILYENTELKKMTNERARDMEEVYTQTVAEKFILEKKIIERELQKHGIHCLRTVPQQVTVNTLNKYLELKARQAI